VMKFPRPSPSVFAYCKRSKNWRRRRPGTRLASPPTATGPLQTPQMQKKNFAFIFELSG